VPPVAADPRSLPPVQIVPYWPMGLNLDMHVFLSTSPLPVVQPQEGLPHFVWKNITYGDYNDNRVIDLEVKFPEVCFDYDFFFEPDLTFTHLVGPQERFPMG